MLGSALYGGEGVDWADTSYTDAFRGLTRITVGIPLMITPVSGWEPVRLNRVTSLFETPNDKLHVQLNEYIASASDRSYCVVLLGEQKPLIHCSPG